MKKKTDTFLCVGGPRAGQRVAARLETGFRVPVLPLPAVKWNWDEVMQPVAQQTDSITYREEVFHTPQGDISMWVPEGQTAHETMEALLLAYEQHRRRPRAAWVDNATLEGVGSGLFWGHIRVGEATRGAGGWHAYYLNDGKYRPLGIHPSQDEARQAVDGALLEATSFRRI